ncbi:MAG: class I SAM-dependent methyltransferase [Myxococcota bacterium]
MTADARFWNEIAEAYSRKPVEDPEAFERKIAITLGCMRPHHVVLDIGCGTGSLALRLAPHAAHVHGLDISTEMVRIARTKAASANISNVSFHVGAVESHDEFAAESLDGVCAYSLLHLVEDRAAVLARIHRLLKPGGFFVSSNLCLSDSWVPYRPLLTAMRWVGKAPRVQTFRRTELERALSDAGFLNPAMPDVGAKPTIAFIVAHKAHDASSTPL